MYSNSALENSKCRLTMDGSEPVFLKLKLALVTCAMLYLEIISEAFVCMHALISQRNIPHLHPLIQLKGLHSNVL